MLSILFAMAQTRDSEALVVGGAAGRANMLIPVQPVKLSRLGNSSCPYSLLDLPSPKTNGGKHGKAWTGE